MNRKVPILDVAKPVCREVKSYVMNQFGETVWNEVNKDSTAGLNGASIAAKLAHADPAILIGYLTPLALFICLSS